VPESPEPRPEHRLKPPGAADGGYAHRWPELPAIASAWSADAGADADRGTRLRAQVIEK
jgi:hypothetical protein